jgi:hypothetical protein
MFGVAAVFFKIFPETENEIINGPGIGIHFVTPY